MTSTAAWMSAILAAVLVIGAGWFAARRRSSPNFATVSAPIESPPEPEDTLQLRIQEPAQAAMPLQPVPPRPADSAAAAVTKDVSVLVLPAIEQGAPPPDTASGNDTTENGREPPSTPTQIALEPEQTETFHPKAETGEEPVSSDKRILARVGEAHPVAVQPCDAVLPAIAAIEPISEVPTSVSVPSNDGGDTGAFAAEAGPDITDRPAVDDFLGSLSIDELLGPELEEAPPVSRPPKKQRTKYRDRRGARRQAVAKEEARPTPEPANVSVPHVVRRTELRLRLTVDHLRQTVSLSGVPLRGADFPDRVHTGLDERDEVLAFDDRRYDDVPMLWTPERLDTELRIADERQLIEWVRSARDIHIFTAEAGEPDLLSVSAAETGANHTVICRHADAADVSAMAHDTGSPAPTDLSSWHGVPRGWCVLAGIIPAHPSAVERSNKLRPLDPGAAIEISLVGGLELRARQYAEGFPPTIRIDDVPDGCVVYIQGERAEPTPDGSWIAPGWDQAGSHLIDIVPGPSLAYEILADPARTEIPMPAGFPALAGHIVGAAVVAGDKQAFFAFDANCSVVALGSRAGVTTIARRDDRLATIGGTGFRPEFLIVSRGLRRNQGQIIWLGRPLDASRPRMARDADERWVSTIRSAAMRRWPLVPQTPESQAAWRSALTAARRAFRRSR